MKKNFRTLLLKESSLFQTDSSNTKSIKIINRPSPYSLLEFSKTKDNSSDSKTVSLNNFNLKFSQITNPCLLVKKNIFEVYKQNNRNRKFPLIKKNYITNKESTLFNSVINQKNRNEKNDINLFNKNQKNSLLNSMNKEESNYLYKQNYPRYIFLNKLFKLKNPKKKNLKLKIATSPKLSKKDRQEKAKSYQLKKEEYKNYINRRVKLHFNDQFESSFVHKIKSEYMVRKLLKKYPMMSQSDKKIDYNDDEYEEEKNDILDENIFNNGKIFRKIKNVLINQDQKYIFGNETEKFFKKKENKINYLFDIKLLPNFRNNLLRENGYSFQEKLDEDNYVESRIWKYLNKAKIKLQKYKDDKKNNEYPLLDEEESNEDTIDLYHNENKEKKDNKRLEEKYDLYDIEDYLSKKKENQSVVQVINGKTKKLFYGTFLKMHNARNISNNYFI
jgi:hypothetical protein